MNAQVRLECIVHGWRARTAGRVAMSQVVMVVALLALTGCVPASPDADTYEDKAVLTLGSALSEVATVQLTLEQLDKETIFRAAALTTLRYSEDNLGTAAKSFTELNPPPIDGRLYERCNSVLGDAEDLLAEVRIAVERGRVGQYLSLLRQLQKLSDRLDRMEKQVGS
jgi:hypothetical protein